jgi:hypothetical protein
MHPTNVLDNDNGCIRFDFVDGSQFLQSDELADDDVVERLHYLLNW